MGQRRVIANLFTSADGFAADRDGGRRPDGRPDQRGPEGGVLEDAVGAARVGDGDLAERDVAEEVAARKAEPGGELGIVGSISIGQQLARAGLLDGYRLLIHPVVLGSAGYKPMFDGFDQTDLQLVHSELLDGRVVAVEYEIKRNQEGESR